MNEEIKRLLDKIMKTTHELVDELVRQGRKRKEGKFDKTEENLSEAIIKTKREKLIDLYRKLGYEFQKQKKSMISDLETFMGRKLDYNEIIEAKEEIREQIYQYLITSYKKMNYIDVKEEDEEIIPNIYHGSDQAVIRATEYLEYENNINMAITISEIEGKLDDNQELTFEEKSVILEGIARYKSYSHIERKIENLIKKVQKDEISLIRREAKKALENSLIMANMAEKYKRVNAEDCGIYTGYAKQLRFIKTTTDDKEIQVILGVNEDDYRGIVYGLYDNYNQKLDQMIGNIFNIYATKKETCAAKTKKHKKVKPNATIKTLRKNIKRLVKGKNGKRKKRQEQEAHGDR